MNKNNINNGDYKKRYFFKKSLDKYGSCAILMDIQSDMFFNSNRRDYQNENLCSDF